MTLTLEQAYAIAEKAHRGKVDKQGDPYIWHVERVSDTVPDEAKVVATLHDVVEDADESISSLRARGLGPVEAEAVDLLTRRDDEEYPDFIERIVTARGESGRLARIVKEADVQDNLGRMTDAVTEREKLESRYRRALERLEAAKKQT
jgi:(p)ppGpp synthase/HD superfamily hydrolase